MPRYLILLLPLMARVTADTPPRHPRAGPSPPDMISYEARNILDHELRGLPDFMPRLGGEGVGMDHASNLGMANGSAFAFTKRQTCGNWGMCPDGGCAPPGGDCCSGRRYCNPGSFCNTKGYGCCLRSGGVCDNGSCAPFEANCCESYGFCYAGYYCTSGGCCRIGTVCSGYAGVTHISQSTSEPVKQTFDETTTTSTTTEWVADTSTTTSTMQWADTSEAPPSEAAAAPAPSTTTNAEADPSAAVVLPTIQTAMNHTIPLPLTSITPGLRSASKSVGVVASSAARALGTQPPSLQLPLNAAGRTGVPFLVAIVAAGGALACAGL